MRAVPGTTTMARALNAALRAALAGDPRVLVAGRHPGRSGSACQVTDGLREEFGPRRIVEGPLAESAVVGTAVGLALRGYRPVVEIRFDGFVHPAFDQMVGQLARLHARSAGRLTVPLVIRVPYAGGTGASEHHSESPEAYFAHTPGLRVVTPSTPHDAYWMLRKAIACDDPVVLLEPRRRYWDNGPIDPDTEPLPLHGARVVRTGRDATLAAYGPAVRVCLEAAAVAASEGHELEVVDLRSLSPLDFTALRTSVRKTGRLVLVHEAPVFMGLGAEIAARLTEDCFPYLEAPVLRVGGRTSSHPSARAEEDCLPSPDRVLEALDRALAY
ncbi:alpha-ketoacid dehydrogenase subunit beta [Kitasatospora sp. NBC_00315]|uniref:alpha-ketoacid dehydrogenase subunit beta n=1 Tax=Kitasatospora sp. NBC_00315 TaxID=2975963 RepID=UPI0032510157